MMEQMAADNQILVGNKEFMNYIRSLELLFLKQNKKEVILLARGKNMKLAIDLAEASKNKFLSDMNIQVEDVQISTTRFDDRDGVEKSVSCIEIKLISN